MIRRIVLRNWKSHYNTVVEFEPGTNIIVGINGAGKSSVLEAIYFALFGPPDKKNFFERTLRYGEKEGYVELAFEFGGNVYTVKRWFSRKGQKDARLDGPEKVITGRAGDVDKKIVEILGTDGKTFMNAVYARQNEMATILQNSKQRKELIDEMIEISEFSKVRDVLVALKNRVRDWLSGAGTLSVREEMERKEKELREKKKLLDERRVELERINKELREMEELLGTLEKKLAEAEEKYKKLKELERKRSELVGRKGSAEKRLSELVDKYGEPSGSEEGDIKKFRSELEKIKATEKEIVRLESTLAHLEKTLREKKEIAEREIPVSENAEEKVKEMENALENLREEERNILTSLAALQKEKESAENDLRRVSEDLKRARKTVEELEEIKRKYGDVSTRISEKRAELDRTLKEIAAIESSIRSEEEFVRSLEGAKKCPVCESPLTEERASELKEKHEKKLQELADRLKELKRKRDEEEKALKELEGIYDKLIRLAETIPDVKGLEEEKMKLEMRLEEIKSEIRETEKRKEDVEKMIKQKGEELKQLRDALKEAQEVLNARKEVRQLEEEREKTQKEIEKQKNVLAGRSSQEIEEKIRVLEKRLEALRTKDELARIEEEIREVEKSLAGLRDAEEEFKKAQNDMVRAETEIKALKESRERTKREVDLLEKDAKAIQDELRKLEEKLEEIEKKTKILETLNRLIPALEAAREKVREARIQAINKALNIVWRGLYPRGDLTEIRLRPEGQDYVLEVKRAGRWIPVDHLSGGEFYDAALALRIAISALKAKELGLLLLDEPTHNLDAEATEALAQLLSKLPEYGLFRQIIVITHDETLQKAATGTAYLFERDKDRNKPTVVKKLAVTHEV